MPEKHSGTEYCAKNRCYTPTEFALFGVGTIVMGVMLGVVGISWFKHQCLPDEYEEMREKEVERRAEMVRERDRDSSGPYRDISRDLDELEKDISQLEDPRTESDKMKQFNETDF